MALPWRAQGSKPGSRGAAQGAPPRDATTKAARASGASSAKNRRRQAEAEARAAARGARRDGRVAARRAKREGRAAGRIERKARAAARGRQVLRFIAPQHTRRVSRPKAVGILVLNVLPFPGLGTALYGHWERGLLMFLLTFLFLIGWVWAVFDGFRIASASFRPHPALRGAAHRARQARQARPARQRVR